MKLGVTISNLNVGGIREFGRAATVAYTWAAPNETKLKPPAGTQYDYYGDEVAVSDDFSTVLVGAPFDDTGGDNLGGVYVYRWNGTSWNETMLRASDVASGDQFGTAVSVSGDGNTLLVGSREHDAGASNAGAAYIYRWNGTGWDETKLVPSDPVYNGRFGTSVCLTGDANTAVIGCPVGMDPGAVYVYRWDGTSWNETKLTASDGATWDLFGHSVSVSDDGNSIAVGSYQKDGTATDSGGAYVYRWNGTSWDETIFGPVTDVNYGNFGYSIAMAGDGNSFVVGAWRDSNFGSAYLYRWSGTSWNETKLIPPSNSARFGNAVAISDDGNTFIVTAHWESFDKGAAYIHQWNGSSWDQTKLMASDAANGYLFGYSVAITGDGNFGVVGGTHSNGTVYQAGAAYVYQGG